MPKVKLSFCVGSMISSQAVSAVVVKYGDFPETMAPVVCVACKICVDL
jgi:hypothetical protein